MMEEVLSKNQRLLMRYFGAVGCGQLESIVMMLELWDEEATLEMLEYCASHRGADQAQLMKASSEISCKYRGREEPEDTVWK